MDHKIDGQTLSRSDLVALLKSAAGADLVLETCILDEADLSNLDLNGLKFERCSFKGTDFTGAQLDDTRFTGCRGAMANFTAARLDGSTWRSSDLNNARFTGASLSEAVFTGCKLTGADFSRSRHVGTRERLALNAGVLLGGLKESGILAATT